MAEPDEILRTTLECLEWHIQQRYGDETAFDAFRRLVAKNIRADGWTPHDHADIHPDQIQSRREKRSTAELSHLQRGHDRSRPQRLNCPVIVVHIDGVERLIDGTNRINFWESIGDQSQHDVHVHMIRGTKESWEPTDGQ